MRAGIRTWTDSTLRGMSQHSNQFGQRVKPTSWRRAGCLASWYMLVITNRLLIECLSCLAFILEFDIKCSYYHCIEMKIIWMELDLNCLMPVVPLLGSRNVLHNQIHPPLNPYILSSLLWCKLPLSMLCKDMKNNIIWNVMMHPLCIHLNFILLLATCWITLIVYHSSPLWFLMWF